DGLHDVVVLAEGGNDQARHPHRARAESLEHLQAGESGHLDVEQHHVWDVRVDQLQGRDPVRSLAYDFDAGVGLEDPDDPGSHERFVVDHRDPDDAVAVVRRSSPVTYSSSATESPWKQTRWTSPAASDRKSTRLNSSHVSISYAVFCLKKKNN